MTCGVSERSAAAVAEEVGEDDLPELEPIEIEDEPLEIEVELGTNPYKFGVVGSTDSHTGLATAEEENFFGKHTGKEPFCDGTHKTLNQT